MSNRTETVEIKRDFYPDVHGTDLTENLTLLSEKINEYSGPLKPDSTLSYTAATNRRYIHGKRNAKAAFGSI